MISRLKASDLFFIFLISLLPIIIFLPSFVSDLVAGGDISLYWFFGSLIKQTVLNFGQLPLWNPYYTSGVPIDSNTVAEIFYPPTWIFLFFGEREAINILIVSHLILLGLTTYLLSRISFKLKSFPSAVVAIALMFTPKIFNHVYGGHYAFIFAFTWVPTAFLLIFKLVDDGKTLKNTAFLGIIFSLMYLSMVQVAFYMFFIYFLYLIFELLFFWWKNNWQLRKISQKAFELAKLYLGTVVFFAGFSSISLLPALSYALNSTRRGLTLFESAIPAIYPDTLLKLFYIKPAGFEPFEVVIYVGVLTLVFSTVGLFKGKDKRVLFFLFLAFFTALFSMGANGPIYRIFFYLVPGFSWFRAPIRIWFFFVLSVVILAGFGVNWLLNLKIVRKILWFKATFAFLLIFLFFWQLWIYDKDYSKPHSIREVTRSNPIFEKFEKSDKLFRIYSIDRSLSYTEAIKRGLYYADGGDVAPLKYYSDFVNAALNYRYEGYSLSVPPNEVIYPESKYYQKPNPDLALLGMLNVKYLVSPETLENPDLIFKEKTEKYLLYENKKFLPRAFIIGNVNSSSKLDPYSLRGLDPSQNAIVETKQKIELRNDFYKEPEISFYSPNEVRIKADLDKEGLLVFADTYYPGWKAFDNGSLVKIYKTNSVVRGVLLSKGDHNLRFIYDPALFKLGLVISGATVIITLFILKKRV